MDERKESGNRVEWSEWGGSSHHPPFEAECSEVIVSQRGVPKVMRTVSALTLTHNKAFNIHTRIDM